MTSANQILRSVRPREIYVLILLTLGHCVMVHTQYSYNLALHHKCLRGHDVRSFTVSEAVDCFLACLQDCLCMAFQIFEENVCELLSTTRVMTPSSLVGRPDCFYYDFVFDHQPCQPGLLSEMNCCATTSSPCQNNGLCEATIPTDYTKARFRCKCLSGYSGDLCQYSARSCRGYTNGSRVPGKHKIFDASMNLFEVFCDFEANSTMAWTLIQSYQLENDENLQRRPYPEDYPVHEDIPAWDSYRLSLSKMKFVQQDSSKWRITCRYDTDGLNYTDYVQGSNDKIDILTYEGDMCKDVEFINVRGYQCTGCTALATQIRSWQFPLQFDSYFTKIKHCFFQTSESYSCSYKGEDNFGVYDCVNPSHRCSASPSSTTQTWFGAE